MGYIWLPLVGIEQRESSFSRGREDISSRVVSRSVAGITTHKITITTSESPMVVYR
jgi:hypothetical protein